MPFRTSRMCLFYEKRQLTGRNVIRNSDIPDITYYPRLNVFAGRSFGQRKANKLPTYKTHVAIQHRTLCRLTPVFLPHSFALTPINC